jgi:hypothetical protein
VARVFVSYRRSESSGHAGRIAERLKRRLGARRVFLDLDLPPGGDYLEIIDRAIERCDAFALLIGPDFPDPRLRDADDVWRGEIAAALRQAGARDLKLIPVLVGGADMPAAENLPAALRPLVRLNALEVSDSRFDYDFERLLAAVGVRRWTRPRLGAIAGGMAVIGTAAAGLVLVLGGGRPVTPARGDAATGAVARLAVKQVTPATYAEWEYENDLPPSRAGERARGLKVVYDFHATNYVTGATLPVSLVVRDVRRRTSERYETDSLQLADGAFQCTCTTWAPVPRAGRYTVEVRISDTRARGAEPLKSDTSTPVTVP